MPGLTCHINAHKKKISGSMLYKFAAQQSPKCAQEKYESKTCSSPTHADSLVFDIIWIIGGCEGNRNSGEKGAETD